MCKVFSLCIAGFNMARRAPATCRRSPVMNRTPEEIAETEGHTRKQVGENRGYGCIYKITHRDSGKAYVGLTKFRFRRRMNGHRNKAMRPEAKRVKDKGCVKLHNAIRKHGWDAFDAKVLYAMVPNHLLASMEITAIAQHGTLTPAGYNLTPGGETSPMLDPGVRAHAREVMQSEEVQTKRAKIFGSQEFKDKVGKESKAVWEGYTAEDRKARAEHMAAASRRGWIEKREAKMADMTARKAKAYWNSLKNRGLERARRMLREHPERYVGRNPIAETEEWWGPSFEQRQGLPARTEMAETTADEAETMEVDEGQRMGKRVIRRIG